MVVSDRIARAFNRSGASRPAPRDIYKVFGRFWHAGFLHKLKSFGISGQMFVLFLLFSVMDGFGLVLDGESSQEYPVNAGVFEGTILGPTFFLLYIH